MSLLLAFVLASVVSVLGTLPLLAVRESRPVGVLMVVLFICIWTAILCYITPAIIWPVPTKYVSLVLLTLIISGGLYSQRPPGDRNHGTNSVNRLSLYGVVASALVLLLAHISTWSIFGADRYAGLIGEVTTKEWTQDVQPKDDRRMRLVSSPNARALAKNVIAKYSNIGSQFHLADDHPVLQKINGKMYYVFPLDFSSFSRWQSADGVPGYARVQVEDPSQEAEFVTFAKGPIKYTPGAYFGKNLRRTVWSEHPMHKRYPAMLQIDAQGEPWWVVPMGEPTVSISGFRIPYVLLVNPYTGASTKYTLDKVPAWVSQTIPEEVIDDNIDYWGKYRGGFINAMWDHVDQVQGVKLQLVMMHDGRLAWQSDITSLSNADDSLVSVLYTDARTGASMQYLTHGGKTSDSVSAAIVSHKDVVLRKVHVTNPQNYSLGGKIVAIAPLVSSSSLFQGVAVADIRNVQHVGVGDTVAEAVRNFELVAGDGASSQGLATDAAAVKVRGRIEKIASEVLAGNTRHIFTLSGDKNVYIAPAGLSVYLPISRAGDTVDLSYRASKQDVHTVTSFAKVSESK